MSTFDDVKAAYEDLTEEAGQAGDSTKAETLEIPSTEPAIQQQLSTEGQAQSEVAPAPEVEPLDAPQMWPADAKEKFKALPRETQEFLVERDKQMNGDYTRKTQEVSQMRRHYEALDKTLEPYIPVLATQRKTPAQFVSEMIQMEQALSRHPVETLKHLIQHYQVNPAQLFAQEQTTQSPVLRDPAIQPYLQKISQLEAWQREQQQYAQARSASDMELTVRDFADEKDATGNLLRPHFNEVAQVVSSILPGLTSQYPDADHFTLLQAAYDEAMKPYQALIGAEKQKQIARSKEAKIAGSTVTSSGVGAVTIAKPKSTVDAVRQAFEELSR